MTVDVVVLQDADCRALDIVILAVAQRPEEGGKPGEAERQARSWRAQTGMSASPSVTTPPLAATMHLHRSSVFK